MDAEFVTAANSMLFRGIPVQKVKEMTECFGGVFRAYSCGENVWQTGESISQIGIVISGRIYMEYCDFSGNKSIIAEYCVGDTFGEEYALSKINCPVFDIVAKENSEIMFLDVSRLKSSCDRNCPEHRQLFENLLCTLAERAAKSNIKISHICKRTIRDKLLSYLSSQAKKQNSLTFTIPFNRQELADYLSVERCAMSKELHKMKNDGLINFSGNEFSIVG